MSKVAAHLNTHGKRTELASGRAEGNCDTIFDLLTLLTLEKVYLKISSAFQKKGFRNIPDMPFYYLATQVGRNKTFSRYGGSRMKRRTTELKLEELANFHTFFHNSQVFIIISSNFI